MKKKIPEALYEVEVYYKRPLLDTMPKISSPEEAKVILRDYTKEKFLDVKEYFWAIFLTNQNSVLAISEIGKGNDRSVIVNSREIYQLALNLNAPRIILAHNHPSGILVHSDRDIKITHQLANGAKLLDMEILDHLIITSEGCISYPDPIYP
ncbi:MAG: JAB domain-containing protein [Flavobacteriales bacterium]|nr:JAB domain-containing protein [Flavobacteriales bacterium]